MFLLNICICAGLMLSLLHRTYQSCSSGTPKQCAEAETAPGTNLAGEGFDITNMERKGAFVLNMNVWKKKDKTCTLCTNPFLDNQKQKLPLSVVDWRATQSCNMKVATELHKSSEALLTSSTSSVDNNWKAGLDLTVGKKGASLMLAGTHSKLSKYSMGKTKSDKFSFATQSMSCEYYSYRVSNRPRLHREFKKAVRQLPKVYSHESKQQFYKLIDNFGTHYITKVKLGGGVNSVTSIRECKAGLEGLSAQEVQMCLEVEASATVKVTITAQAKHCKQDVQNSESKAAFSSLFNDRFTEIKGGHTTEPDLLFSATKDPSAYKEWLNTVPKNPDVLSYSLDSLHDLYPAKLPAHQNLRLAIRDYILEKGLMKNCSIPCATGVKTDSKDPCACQCHNVPGVKPDCCPTRKGMAQVIITAQRATGLWGDNIGATDGYVKVHFNKQFWRSPVIDNNNNPHWNYAANMGTQDVSMGPKVVFEVWDRDSGWDDDLLGKCEQSLYAGEKTDVCNLNNGQLFFKLDVKCAPGLGGRSCTEYKPSPMNPSLQKFYVSRHAHPIPKALLLEMGVFVNGTSSYRNHTFTVETKKYDLL